MSILPTTRLGRLSLDDLIAAARKQSGREDNIRGWQVQHPEWGLGVITRVVTVTTNAGQERYIDSVFIRFEQAGTQETRFSRVDFDRAGFVAFYPSEQEVKRENLLKALRATFESSYLSADEIFDKHPDKNLITADEYKSLKTEFVREWADRQLDVRLDDEQAAAVATVTGDVQVVARAGSGKTTAVVTRAVFLQQHCGVSPDQLLLLALNRKAAEEMRTRLEKKLGAAIPHVMTFHALAYAIVHPDESILYDKGPDDEFGLGREIQEIIDEHIRSDSLRPTVREIMLADFREDWERIVNGRFELPMKEFLEYRRALPRETLRGERVRSFGEKVIANALFEHAIDYHYERPIRWEGITYRPDFTIITGRDRGVIIEYFGLEGDPDYDEAIESKRKFWARKPGWKLIEVFPRDLQVGIDQFVSTLLNKLARLGISYRRLSEEEIWELVKCRAIDRFTEAITQFVGRCRLRNLSADELRRLISAHKPCSRSEKLFLEAASQIYDDYLRLLARDRKEDFSGLLWRAVNRIRSGVTAFTRDRGRERGNVARLRYILIDEFQDFSEAFFALIEAIRSVNPGVSFFCVGDDWQAINGFAGSDLRYFSEFQRLFRDTTTLYMPANYRSVPAVVDVGNALMRGRGTSAVARRSGKGTVALYRIEDFAPTELELQAHHRDPLVVAVLRLARHFLDSGKSVVLLARRNEVSWPGYPANSLGGKPRDLDELLTRIKRCLPKAFEDKIAASTVHRFKGQECDAVIVLDALDRCFPLIHPNWQYCRLFGDTLAKVEDEERRLFYVAVTRARDSLVLLTSSDHQSPYIQEISTHRSLSVRRWESLPLAISLESPGTIVVIYGNTAPISGVLRDWQFRWDPVGRWWYRLVEDKKTPVASLIPHPLPDNVTWTVYSHRGEQVMRRHGPAKRSFSRRRTGPESPEGFAEGVAAPRVELRAVCWRSPRGC
ncbi:MAG: UvrD-helicase domain-containing protein [Limnochordales bacterium]|nr:UvrD-helicase domain-containing protein [Limnochordales bacterium]